MESTLWIFTHAQNMEQKAALFLWHIPYTELIVFLFWWVHVCVCVLFLFCFVFSFNIRTLNHFSSYFFLFLLLLLSYFVFVFYINCFLSFLSSLLFSSFLWTVNQNGGIIKLNKLNWLLSSRTFIMIFIRLRFCKKNNNNNIK